MGEAAPLLSTLVERLRGVYRLGVNDGAGLLDGKDTFTREFQTPPIQHEAADRIEGLEAQRNTLLDAAKGAFVQEVGRTLASKVIANNWQWPDEAPERVSLNAEALRAAISKALDPTGSAGGSKA